MHHLLQRIDLRGAAVCVAAAIAVVLAGMPATADNHKAQAKLKDADGATVATATLKQLSAGVQIVLTVKKLPQGEHAFHIHETGKCTPPNFKSAGGHFNPDGHSHGLNHKHDAHAGDMPNIHVGKDGTTTVEVVNERVTLKSGAANSLFKKGGTAFIIHGGADDYQSQPSGAAGKRIACGVIRR